MGGYDGGWGEGEGEGVTCAEALSSVLLTHSVNQIFYTLHIILYFFMYICFLITLCLLSYFMNISLSGECRFIPLEAIQINICTNYFFKNIVFRRA